MTYLEVIKQSLSKVPKSDVQALHDVVAEFSIAVSQIHPTARVYLRECPLLTEMSVFAMTGTLVAEIILVDENEFSENKREYVIANIRDLRNVSVKIMRDFLEKMVSQEDSVLILLLDWLTRPE